MNLRRFAAILALLSIALTGLQAQDENANPTSPEDRERAVQVARAFEKDPLNKKIAKDKEWLLRLLIEASDIHIDVCSGMMPGVLNNKENHGTELMLQSMFSQAVFQIENPERADDKHANYLAGVEGMLNAYEAIRAKKKKVEIGEINDLLKRREEGTLADFVSDAQPGCSSESGEE